MTRRLALALVALLGAATPLLALPPDGSAELPRLLNAFLAGASRNDLATHQRFWADDLVYTSSSGKRMGKAEILREVTSAPAPKPGEPVSTYTAEDVRVQPFGDTAVVTFKLVATTKSDSGGEVATYFNTGVFVKRGGEWRAVAWQATRTGTTSGNAALPAPTPSPARP